MVKSCSVFLLVLGLLGGCDSGDNQQAREALLVPERIADTYVTDQMEIARQVLNLWFDEGGCKLQISVKGKEQGERRLLRPKAPCFFVKSPGTERVQIYQQDKTTRIVAVLGTPVAAPPKSQDQRCGRELQGLIINEQGAVKLSTNVQAGSVWCAGSGLDNLQYTLFSTY